MAPFPEDMARFIEVNIESVAQLEMLRVLADDRERVWRAADLAPEVQARPQATARDLATLERRGLVTAVQGPGLSYRYGPRGRELEDKASRLLLLYNERPVSMIRMISARANRAPESFAEAISKRKEG